ncbi:chorion class B protein PC10-like isoform X3 [Nymphalis io]|uniref:chorion class B protein PC10-like isoform X3 n=1 Tax=Inachis io TaxID=171585 RepID=UPI00216A4123|nr:chorion class B protein PC10-like isoform X3 [Nymphalis io]
MASKTVFLFCAQALFVQIISAQFIGTPYDGLGWGAAGNGLAWEAAAGPYGAATPCAGPWNAAPYATAEWATGYTPGSFTVSNGGGFAVTSASPIGVTGVALTSENAYEGPLAVTGALPFLGAVALEGPLATAGVGAVTYGCGNGNVAILNEDINLGYNGFAAPYGPYGAAELGYGYGAPLAYEAGLAGPAYGYRGYGCGGLY